MRLRRPTFRSLPPQRRVYEVLLLVAIVTGCIYLFSPARQTYQNTTPWYMHSDDELTRLETIDVWRPPLMYSELSNAKPSKKIDNIYLMVKTGGSEMWRKLPMQLLTTLTKVEHFGLYSDAPGSIAGHEVIDVLQNSTNNALDDFEFNMYKAQRHLRLVNGQRDQGEVDINQGWTLDRFKNIPMLEHAFRNAPQHVQWFMFIDADTYVMMHSLMRWLDKFDPHQPHYFGSRAYVDWESFAHGGTGVVISREALRRTVGTQPELVQVYESQTFGECCGDLMVARMLREHCDLEIYTGFEDGGFSVFQGNPVWDIDFWGEKWCEPILSFHHLSQHDIEVLYEYEQVNPQPLYRDVYLDFVLPWIDQAVEDWDNGAQDLWNSYSDDRNANWLPLSEGGSVERPYESAECCQKACREMNECMMWRFVPAERYCGFSTGTIKLGRAVYEWIKRDNGEAAMNTTGTVSGWMIDRVRDRRRTKKCDPIYGVNDSDDKWHEGWARRARSWKQPHMQEN